MTANHEVKPALVDFHRVLLHGAADTFSLRRNMKLPPYLEALSHATVSFGDSLVYADISHMWIKSWADVIMDWLASADPRGELFEVDVIVLRRYMPHVLRSLLTDKQTWNPATRLELFSGGEYTVFHRQWALLPPVSAFGTLDSVELAATYVIDMELQLQKFRRDHGQRVRITEWRSEELFTVDGAQRLLHHLRLDPLIPRCVKILHTAKPVNQHVSWKGPQMLTVDTNAFIARVLRLRDKYAAAGGEVAAAFPVLPHLTLAYPCANITAMGAAGDVGHDGAVVPDDGSAPTPGQPFEPAMALLHPDEPMGMLPLPPGDPRRATASLWCATTQPRMDAATIQRWLQVEIPNNTPPFVTSAK